MVWPNYCLVFLAFHHGFGREFILREPHDITVEEGGRARLHCQVANLQINHTMQWSINGIIHGPWQASSHQGSYSYPKDGDTSLGIYDMVIDTVTWRQHCGSTFQCQILQTLRSSRVATLTVTVPPTHVDILPPPTDGLVVIDDTSETANISCGINSSTPGSKIRWQSDGNPCEGTVSVENITNGNDARLEQVSSTIVLSREKMNYSAVPVSTSYQPLGPKGDALIDRKMYLEERYETVYHVTCHAYNHKIKENITNTAWIVFERTVSTAGRMAAVTLWILIGLICGLVATAIFIVGYVLLRSGRRDTTIQKNTDNVTVLTNQGLCSSTTSDRQSDVSTLRPSGGSGNIHLLHGQADGTGSDAVLESPDYTDRRDIENPLKKCFAIPFDRGDYVAIASPGTTQAESKENLISSSSQSTRASYMRGQMIRFLDLQTSPRRPPQDLPAVTPTHFEENAYSLPRFNAISRLSNLPMNNVALNNESAGENTGQLSTFASLPRYVQQYPRSAKHASTISCVTTKGTRDSLPLPPPPTPPTESPSQDVPDLPPPMFDIYSSEINHNLVSRGNNYNTGRVYGVGMPDPSPNSGSSGPNSLRGLPGAGSLV